LAAFNDWDSKGLLILLFGGIGLVQSVDFPCFISTIGAWTSESTRGTVTGIWATCGNVGNILGIQLAAAVLRAKDNQWGYLMMYVTISYLCLALLIFSVFIADP